jgi:hypothetical protein
MKKFEVAIIYRGQANYIVEAKNKEEAEAKARVAYRDGTREEFHAGNEWEEVDEVRRVEEMV